MNFRTVREGKEEALARVAELEAEIGTLRGDLVKSAVRIAGFDPDNPLAGLVIEKFQTAIEAGDQSPTPDAFRGFAETLGLSAAAPSDDGPTPTANPIAAEINRLQTVGDSLRAASTAPNPAPGLDQRIAEAEAAGNWDASMALKAQKLRQMAQ